MNEKIIKTFTADSVMCDLIKVTSKYEGVEYTTYAVKVYRRTTATIEYTTFKEISLAEKYFLEIVSNA